MAIPVSKRLDFVLGDGYFNPQRRNEVNYSHEYVTGFPELEWFDSASESMMAQFQCQHHRGDSDITDINRFFGDQDPETCDVGDFYGDEAQMLWCSIDCYVRLLKALGITQNFITVEKLDALAKAHLGDDFPRLREGIRISLAETLQEGAAE